MDVHPEAAAPAPTDNDDFERRFAAAVHAIEERKAESAVRSDMWLAHHWPEHHERCTVIGGRRVCRRCLWLYPLAIVVAVVALAGVTPWPAALDTAFVWGLSALATAEFVTEQLGLLAYNAKRQVAATVLSALAFGRALAYELDGRWDGRFWAPLLVFGLIWFGATVVAQLRRSSSSR